MERSLCSVYAEGAVLGMRGGREEREEKREETGGGRREERYRYMGNSGLGSRHCVWLPANLRFAFNNSTALVFL